MNKKILDLRGDGSGNPLSDNEPGGGGAPDMDALYAWEAPEFVVYRKNTWWYMIFGLVMALLVSSALWMKSFLTLVVFVLAGILIFAFAERRPQIVPFAVRRSGIRVADKFLPFGEIESYNIVERGHGVYMLMKRKKLFAQLLHIPLGDADPAKVKFAIGRQLPEDKEIEESMSDIIAHWLGF